MIFQLHRAGAQEATRDTSVSRIVIETAICLETSCIYRPTFASLGSELSSTKTTFPGDANKRVLMMWGLKNLCNEEVVNLPLPH